MPPRFTRTLDVQTSPHPELQRQLEALDTKLGERYGMTTEHTALGLLDLLRPGLAMIHPDRVEYAASVAKIGILLSYFHLHPEAASCLNTQTRHELGLMIKSSSNELAAKFSRELGLKHIQEVLNSCGLYDPVCGGLWVGKHYGEDGERIADPLSRHSHAATVRQLLRFYLLLERGQLVSAPASQIMREIFASPNIPHDPIKFVKGLAGRGLNILRKWGSWEDWLHDTAVIIGPGRHYILVALTHHPRGDEFLVELARAVDDLMVRPG